METEVASTSQPLVCELTPPGRAAIATIAVTGDDAAAAVERFFCWASGKRVSEAPTGRILFGRWSADGGETGAASPGEEVVVCRTSADRVEIHCHGGKAAAAAIRASLVSAGCRAVDWKRWLEATETDPLAAEAHAALAEARTRRAAAILLDQHAGALRRSVTAVRDELESGNIAGAGEQIDKLLRFAPLGLHLTRPWRVVLAGRPNVGKSSLINALVGYRRAIVHDTPGVTRDVLTAQTALDGWPVELADTAGVRESGDALETAGVAGARRELETADVVLLVFDASQPWSVEDAAILSTRRDAIVVHNKRDLACDDAGRPAGFMTCAVSGEGLPALIEAVVARIVPEAPAPGAAVPFTARQVDALHEARTRLKLGNPREAAACLRKLVSSEPPL